MNAEYFFALTPIQRRRSLLAATGTAVTLMIILNIIGAPLVTTAAPQGIISYEFAGDLQTAQQILASWDHDVKVRAGLSLGLDFLFPPAYAAAIALSCLAAAGGKKVAWQRVGQMLAWGMLLAAGLDYIENVALIQLLLGGQDSFWPLLAYWCAAVKFALVLAGIGYALAGGVQALFKRFQKL